MHHRDIVSSMLKEGVEKASDFLIKVQIKYTLKGNPVMRTQSFSSLVEDYVNNMDYERSVAI